MTTAIWTRCPQCDHLHVERSSGYHPCRRPDCVCPLTDLGIPA